MDSINILGIPIAAVNMEQTVAEIESWVKAGPPTYVTVTGVHGIILSQDDPEIRRMHLSAGMCVPDGMPTVWLGRLFGYKNMTRVYGPNLMLEFMRISAHRGYKHFFFGGKEGVAEVLRNRLLSQFPDLQIVGTYSPPFRPMTDSEEKSLSRIIDRAAPDIIWVGLSTPKQEHWMAVNIGKLNAKVMIGVGAAFDFNAGLVKQAPVWVQRIGLEWLFRLIIEPGRLWRRYLFNNPRFVWLIIGQLLGLRKYDLD